ncbi:MAG: selenide, water dikinase SelD [Bacteroidia bacterium]|nr:selenide, water dikinase SelD [Bacteroidia bacterium]
MKEEIRLTKYSHGGGCGCKIAPGVLKKVIGSTAGHADFPHLLVGNEKADDAAVMDIGGDQLLISTVDFFMPVVDNAADFGKIAAANSVSDVYAMGGKPVMAIAVLGWPVEKLPVEMAQEVMRGAKELAAEAGIPIAGGHTIDSPEPFFGLSVNGLVRKEHLKTNAGGKPGDLLYMTKPLGVGIITTAAKRGLAGTEETQRAIVQMQTLNREGEEFGKMSFVHALTDITGFGILGHLGEMCEASGVSAKLYKDKVVVIPEARSLAAKMIYPDATFRNWKSYESKITGMDPALLILFADPQTSGGLLLAVDPAKRNETEAFLRGRGLPDQPVGELIAQEEKIIIVI